MFRNQFAELADLIVQCGPVVLPDLERAAQKAHDCLDKGHKILIAGNGGSAAEAQHFAAELVGRFMKDRAPLAAIALNCDSSILTAVGNDCGFERVFERQVGALAKPGDLLLLLSTSGRSLNIITAAARARALGCAVVGFTGADGGKLADVADVLLSVPSTSVPRVQEVHLACLHLLAGYLEDRRFGPREKRR